MVFSSALTGIQATTTELEVIGNNIANSATIGFKQSRAEFADIYTASNSVSGGSSLTGAGVQISNIRQSHAQGTIELTGNNLDIAVGGEGFFILEDDSGTTSYTRAGAFALDKSGFIIDPAGKRLQGLNANNLGVLNQVTTGVQLDTSSSAPSASSTVTLGVNLDSGATPPTTGNNYVGGSSVSDNTYTNLSSTTIYDSLGNSHVLSLYYIKADDSTGAAADIAGNNNQWYLGAQIDGNDIYTQPGATNALNLPELTFNQDGSFASLSVPGGVGGVPAGDVGTRTNGVSETTGETLQFIYDPDNGSEMMNFNIDFNNQSTGGSTQFGSDFSVQTSQQNGFSTGRIEDLEIDPSGIILGRFSNGQSRTLGQVQLASFKNPEALEAISDSSWTETVASGTPTVGVPETGSLGGLSAGSLEQSNVDLTSELVALITSQRNFQANAQTISTADAITQTIINIR